MSKKSKNDINSKGNGNIAAFLSDNKKFLMPIILLVAVVITIIIALGANKRTKGAVQTSTAETEASTYEVPQVSMELNAYPEVNALVEKYYAASAAGDADTLSQIYKGLDDTEILKSVAASEYIEKFENIDVYTKPGPVEGSYVAYVYNEVKLYEYDANVPGLETLYICSDDNGELYINGDIADINELDYLKQINVQEDVIDLNNKVASSYNEMVSADEQLAELLTKMRSGLQVSVGEALATSEATAPDESTKEDTGDDDQDDTVVVSRVIRATDVINIRSSDSETADILDRTTKGQEFKELEALANGWSKVEYKGEEAYVKTEFFEVVSEERVAKEEAGQSETDNAGAGAAEDTENAEGTEDAAAENDNDTNADAANNASSDTKDKTSETAAQSSTDDKKTESSADASSKEESSKKVSDAKTGKTVVEQSVKLRKEQSTDSESQATIFAGGTVNVLEQYENGWAKVEYVDKKKTLTGYIKSEYLRQ
jgi:uncharacterized protein YgiM (DUF1202 family)